MLESVESSTDMALNVAALVATAGAGAPAITAARTAARTTIKKVTKEMVKEQLKGALVKMARDQVNQRANAMLDNDESLDKAAAALAKANNEGQLNWQVMIPSVADFDPTGVMAVVNAFNKPLCRKQ